MGNLIKHIDLTTRSVKEFTVSKEFVKRWLGGRGFNSRILYCFKNKTPSDWHADENVVAISSGKLSGTVFPSSGRTTISVLKSPVSGMFSDGNFGGHFGPALRLAGIEGLVITGKLDELSYLHIGSDGSVKFRCMQPSASKWGCATTSAFLEHINHEPVKVLSVGQGAFAGCFSAVVNCDDRVAGGGGSGAVLASKNIKAIVVDYDRERNIRVKHPVQFEQVSEDAVKHIEKHPVFNTFKTYGTTSLVEIHSALKYFPTNNFMKRTFKGWKKISGQAYLEKELETYKEHRDGKGYIESQEDLAEEGKLGCRNCPIVCSNQDKVEYETLNCLGNKIGIDDIDTIVFMNTVYFNDAGLDVIETTSIISALMEMSERGMISSKFEFGNVTAVKTFLDEFITGEEESSFGSCFRGGFVKGLRRAEYRGFLGIYWDLLGFKSYEELADEVYVSSKGKAYSGVYPNQANKGVALATATSTRGADHLRSLPTLATYASWYMGKGGWKKLIKLLTVPLRSAKIMKSDAKFLVGDLWETYHNVFGVPMAYLNEWKMKGFLLDNRINKGWGGMIKFTQSLYAISDSLSTCRFTSPWRFGVGPQFWLPALRFMGFYITQRSLFLAGHHINLLEKEMLFCSGLPVKDKVPQRFFKGRGALKHETWTEIYHDYLKECNMDSTGRPRSSYMNPMLSGDYMDRDMLKYFEKL